MFDKSGMRLAAVGACLFEFVDCLGLPPVHFGCDGYCNGESGLRVGEGGFKFFSFGHDLCRGCEARPTPLAPSLPASALQSSPLSLPDPPSPSIPSPA